VGFFTTFGFFTMARSDTAPVISSDTTRLTTVAFSEFCLFAVVTFGGVAAIRVKLTNGALPAQVGTVSAKNDRNVP
jgi:hypothetical protein